MNHFSNLFGKLKRALDTFDQERKMVQEVITKHCVKAPDAKEIEVKGNILFLDTNPSFKQAVFVKKQLILEDFKEKNLKIFDIR